MPKKAASSSSSSSSEEDLAAFQSVAVTFEEITSKQKEVAEQAKQRIAGSGKRKRKAEKTSAGKGEDGAGAEQDSAGEDDDGPCDQLDPFQLKVAASLDSMLEGRLRLKEPGPKKKWREARAAEREAEDVDSTFRFFARVKPGEAVVLQPPELPPLEGTPFPEVLRNRRAPAAEEAAAALSLLAVDGTALMQAAAAAAAAAGGSGAGGGAGTAADAAQAAGDATEGAQQPQKKKKKKQKQRHLGEGMVIDPKTFVPHDARIGRLVGVAAGSGLAC